MPAVRVAHSGRRSCAVMENPAPLASALAILAAMQFAGGTLLAKRGLESTNSVTGALISIATSALVYWLLMPFAVELHDWRSPAVLIFAAIGLLRPSVSTMLAYEGTRRLGPTISATFASFSPLFAMAGAVLFLSETLRPTTLAGILGVVAGIMVLTGRGGARRGWTASALLFPVGASLIRASAHVGAKWGLNLLPSVVMSGLVAYTVSLLVALAITLARGDKALPDLRSEGLKWLVAAGLLNAGAIFALNTGLMIGEVVVVSPLVATYPLFTMLGSRLFYGQEALTRRTVAGVLLLVPSVMLITLAR